MSNKRAITSEDLKKIEVFSDPQFTPDGKAYTYVSTKINEKNEYESNVYYQNLVDQKARQWTFGHHKTSNLRFSPNGKYAVFQSNRSGVPQLWLMNTDGGEARQITSFKNGAFNPLFSKDSKSIIFSASLDLDDDVHNQKELSKEERQKEQEEKNKQPLLVNRLEYKANGKGFLDSKRVQIIVFDVENETFTQLTNADVDHSFQDISPDGKSIIFAANLSEDADYEIKNDLHLLNLDTKEEKKLTSGVGSYYSAVFSPSGKMIACSGHGYEYAGATLTELFIFDIETGERTCLTVDFDIQLGALDRSILEFM